MSDPTDVKSMPGYDSAASNYSTATKTMQDFASEMQRMSKDTMDQTSQMMEYVLDPDQGSAPIAQILQTDLMRVWEKGRAGWRIVSRAEHSLFCASADLFWNYKFAKVARQTLPGALAGCS